MTKVTSVFVTFFVISLSTELIQALNNPNGKIEKSLTFPTSFEFGASTAAYQVEGGWDVDGKGMSIWDHMCHTNPDFVKDGSNGDVAARSYYQYKRDIEMLRELGVKSYRFSISWPRILPRGIGEINPLGIAYYNDLIDELINNEIEPYVTMYHWDLPQPLSELGGWLNEDIADWFGAYAKILYENFGDRVKNWMTVNEPQIHCFFGYGVGAHAPGYKSPGVGFYECGRNLLLANARAYHIYKDQFKDIQNGQVGIVLNMRWVLPQSDSDDDKQAAEDFFAFFFQQYMEPIFGKEGNYPQIMIDKIAAASARQGLNSSRLRPFTKEQIEYLKGTADFLGINHYTTRIIYRNSSLIGKYDVPSPNDDANFGEYMNDSWPSSESPWMKEYSPGFYKLLMYIKEKYNNVPVYITENGFPTGNGLNDDTRVHYLRNYWKALLDALNDGCNIKGYFIWSLMDSFEWASGYMIRFGIYEIDIEDPQRPRTPRKSTFVYKKLIKTRSIDFNYDPDPYAGGSFSFFPSFMLILVLVLASVIVF